MPSIQLGNNESKLQLPSSNRLDVGAFISNKALCSVVKCIIIFLFGFSSLGWITIILSLHKVINYRVSLNIGNIQKTGEKGGVNNC